jgi:hypothetical protein
VPERALGKAHGAGLVARDHVNLTIQDPGQRSRVNASRRYHMAIMRTGSDIPAA